MRKFMLNNFRCVTLLIAIVVAVITPTPDARAMLILLVATAAVYLLVKIVTRPSLKAS